MTEEIQPRRLGRVATAFGSVALAASAFAAGCSGNGESEDVRTEPTLAPPSIPTLTIKERAEAIVAQLTATALAKIPTPTPEPTLAPDLQPGKCLIVPEAYCSAVELRKGDPYTIELKLGGGTVTITEPWYLYAGHLPIGVPVFAPFNGYVSYTEQESSFEIVSDDETLRLRVSGALKKTVEDRKFGTAGIGQTIRKGQTIATVGWPSSYPFPKEEKFFTFTFSTMDPRGFNKPPGRTFFDQFLR